MQPRCTPITGAAEFQRTAIKEKSQNSSHTALQTTMSLTSCGARGRAGRAKQKQVKGINPNTDFCLSNTQHGHSLGFRYHLWNTTVVITPTVLLVQWSLQRIITGPLQKCTCTKSLVPGSALHCPTETSWYTDLYSLIFLHPQGISFLKARGNFYHATPWIAGMIPAEYEGVWILEFCLLFILPLVPVHTSPVVPPGLS